MNLRPGSASSAAASSGEGVTALKIDVVHIVEESVGRHAVQAHQPGKRRAVLVVIGLAQDLRLFERDAEAVRR